MDNNTNDNAYGQWRVRSERLVRRRRRKELDADRPRKGIHYTPPVPEGYEEQHEARILAEQARVEREMAALEAAGKEIQ